MEPHDLEFKKGEITGIRCEKVPATKTTYNIRIQSTIGYHSYCVRKTEDSFDPDVIESFKRIFILSYNFEPRFIMIDNGNVKEAIIILNTLGKVGMLFREPYKEPIWDPIIDKEKDDKNRIVVLSEERVDYYYKELSFCTTSKEMSEWHTEEIYREPALELIANRKKKKKGTIKDNIIKSIFTNVNGVTSIVLNPYAISVIFGIAFDTGEDVKKLIAKILMDCLEGEFIMDIKSGHETDKPKENINARIFPQE